MGKTIKIDALVKYEERQQIRARFEQAKTKVDNLKKKLKHQQLSNVKAEHLKMALRELRADRTRLSKKLVNLQDATPKIKITRGTITEALKGLNKRDAALNQQARQIKENIKSTDARKAMSEALEKERKALRKEKQQIEDNKEALRSIDRMTKELAHLDKDIALRELKLEYLEALGEKNELGKQMAACGAPIKHKTGAKSKGVHLSREMWGMLAAMKAETGKPYGEIILQALELHLAQPRMQAELEKALKKHKKEYEAELGA